MKRDCGPGNLIPTHFAIHYYATKTDREQKEKHPNLLLAKQAFASKCLELQNVEYSDVRLYAVDKQGYCNCILSAKYNGGAPMEILTDRLDKIE